MFKDTCLRTGSNQLGRKDGLERPRTPHSLAQSTYMAQYIEINNSTTISIKTVNQQFYCVENKIMNLTQNEFNRFTD